MNRNMITVAMMMATILAPTCAFAQAPGGPARPWPPGSPGGVPPMRGPMQGPMMEGPMMRRMVSEELDRALNQAAVSPEQRAAIHASRDRVFAEMEAQHPDPTAERDRMLALFEGADLAQPQLEALHQQGDQQRQAIRTAIDRAIVEVHNVLSPAQRKVIAQYFRTHTPGGAPPGIPGPRAPGAASKPPGPGVGGPPPPPR